MLVNFDVLTYLMSITEERTDVSSLMRTCRTLYSAGIPSLLSFDIDFDVWERFAAFCSFMDVDAPGRSRFLRRMTLYMHHLTRARRTRTLGHILRILQHASQLHELSIETNDEEQRFDPLDPHLIEALSGLTSIKDLASPAAKVYLFFEDDWSSSEFSHLDPIFVLKQFGPSLRRLEVLFPAFSQVLRHGIQYPHLTELEISHISPLLALDPLIYSFPNLRILRFSEMDTFGCFIQMQLYRAADYLMHLHIKVEFRGREGEDDVSGAINNVMAALPQLTCMTHFSIQLCYYGDLDILPPSLLLLDRENIATRAMEVAAPAIQYIVVNVYKDPMNLRSVWQVTRKDGDANSLNMLTCEAAQKHSFRW
ncbi:hypothetical protein EW026_g1711 [Hermanssonia centrifuga]|uniref:F-box domain-containing protein n=1 Tax=Hermanssonia centrifuga TaxID=98765 RepID=A0A4S4KSC0_9APHY|nr:hypothetical protein EW026_g1711 [Hermanssonia centrifuga]